RAEGNKDDRAEGNKDDRAEGNKDDRAEGNKDDRAEGNKDDRAATRAARTLNHEIVGAGFIPAQNAKEILIQNNLGDIVGAFKSIFVWEYIQNVKTKNWPRFFKRLWQRDYYERIVRNEAEYLRIKQYIIDNPMKYKFNRGCKTSLL
ncbi:MAG: hypothetical protein WC503_06880, partial [Candidatus Shapirobacteria bacterium]